MVRQRWTEILAVKRSPYPVEGLIDIFAQSCSQKRNLRGNPRSEAYQQSISDEELQIAPHAFTRVIYVPHRPHQVEGIQIRTIYPMN